MVAARKSAPVTAVSSRSASQKSHRPPAAGTTPETNGHHLTRPTDAEIAEKVKELVRLAQEQGYLTHGDVSEVLPEKLISAEELDEIIRLASAR